MPNVPLSILLVEDTEFTRRGLHLFLEQGGFSIMEADNVQDAICLAIDRRPDVAVVDLILPMSPGAEPDYTARSGLEVVQQLKAHYPDLAIVILSAYPDRGAVILEMVQRKGWKGVAYLLKGGKATEVEQAIYLTLRGGVHFDPSVNLKARTSRSQIVLDSLGAAEREVVIEALSHLEHLTPRELDVLSQIGEALGPDEAAAVLHITTKTWNNHRHSICTKLGLNVSEATSLRKDVLLAKIALIHRLEIAVCGEVDS